MEDTIGFSISWCLGITQSTKGSIRRADPLVLPLAETLHHQAYLTRLMQDICYVASSGVLRGAWLETLHPHSHLWCHKLVLYPRG